MQATIRGSVIALWHCHGSQSHAAACPSLSRHKLLGHLGASSSAYQASLPCQPAICLPVLRVYIHLFVTVGSSPAYPGGFGLHEPTEPHTNTQVKPAICFLSGSRGKPASQAMVGLLCVSQASDTQKGARNYKRIPTASTQLAECMSPHPVPFHSHMDVAGC